MRTPIEVRDEDRDGYHYHFERYEDGGYMLHLAPLPIADAPAIAVTNHNNNNT